MLNWNIKGMEGQGNVHPIRRNERGASESLVDLVLACGGAINTKSTIAVSHSVQLLHRLHHWQVWRSAQVPDALASEGGFRIW